MNESKINYIANVEKEYCKNKKNNGFLQESNFLTTKEAAQYLKLSKGSLYQLMHKHQIGYYKPNGKMVYFLKSDLDNWITSTRVSSTFEINQEALNYLKK